MTLRLPIQEMSASSDTNLQDAFEQGVRDILKNLENANIDFCILRNRDRIPAGLIEGSDVDILVHSDATGDLLGQVMAMQVPVHAVQRREVLCTYYLIDDQLLKIDYLYRDQEWLGAKYLVSKEVLGSKRDDRGLQVASKWHEAFLCWFHGMLWGGTIKERYIPVIQEAALEFPEEFGSLLNRTFGSELGNALLQKAVKGEPLLSKYMVRQCRKSLWSRALRRKPRVTLHGLLDHFRQEFALRFWLRPAGLSVAVLGPDGSGKSSVCAALLNEPRTRFPSASRHRIHLFRQILPTPGDVRKGKLRPTRGKGQVVTDPHGRKPHSLILSSVRMAYFVLCAWVSEISWSRHQIAKNGLILSDRHLIELNVDPARYRFGAPPWIGRLMGRAAPQPDLVILLDAPTEVLQSRKQEVPYSETERQRRAYLELVHGRSSGFVVDASQPVEEVVADVRAVILKYMADRTRRNFGLQEL